MKTPLIIAHRGGSSIARANTIAAFEDAIALQSDLIELDVAPSWQIIDSLGLSKIILVQMPCWVWTVNDVEMMQKLLKDERVEAIITDQPQLGLQLRT